MPRQGVMLCYQLDEKRLLSYPTPWLCQPKLDGVRARWDPYTRQLLSSQGNAFTSVPHITDQLQNCSYELDGELYSPILPFEEVVSRVKRTVWTHEDATAISFYVFDIINHDEQIARLGKLETIGFASSYIRKVPSHAAAAYEHVMEWLDLFLAQGYEGIIIRNPKGMYKPSRSTDIMKYKPRLENYADVIGLQEEHDIEGRPKGRLGAFVCQTSEGIIFNVGTGFNHDQRTRFWTSPPQQILYKYQNLTTSGVPRFPVYAGEYIP